MKKKHFVRSSKSLDAFVKRGIDYCRGIFFHFDRSPYGTTMELHCSSSMSMWQPFIKLEKRSGRL